MSYEFCYKPGITHLGILNRRSTLFLELVILLEGLSRKKANTGRIWFDLESFFFSIKHNDREPSQNHKHQHTTGYYVYVSVLHSRQGKIRLRISRFSAQTYDVNIGGQKGIGCHILDHYNCDVMTKRLY